MRIYMQMPGTEMGAPRFYHLAIQQDLIGGWTLVREWGFQGSAGRVAKENHDTLEAAVDALIRIRDLQLRKGYRVVFAEGRTPSG